MKEFKGVGDLYKLGDFRGGLVKLEELWRSIPEPKSNFPNAYLVIEYAVKLCMQLRDLDSAWQWANLAPKYNQNRQDLGEAEFLVGKVALEKGDLDEAKAQFLIANHKSRGKIFQGEDSKYEAVIQG
jgi:tetratricopeptide (TPR) repeat protein